jgi:IclR family KDG regulon transcriptional repressor
MMTPRGALVVSTLAGKSPIEIGVRAGSELSYHASAQGKVIAAYGPDELRLKTLSIRPTAYTAKTVTDPASLRLEFKRIVEQGYASAPEQVLLGINSIAAPVFDESGTCTASIAIVGSIQHIHEDYEKVALGPLRKCVEKVSQRLGFSRRNSVMK